MLNYEKYEFLQEILRSLTLQIRPDRGLMRESVRDRDVQDAVHGQIWLSPLAYRIINTREFKRLKSLKQLGNSCEVYPTATHTRFEHSLGVYHLASKTIEELKKLGEDITPADQLCVEIAGLCHDLGHGPYSHLWESFTKLANTKAAWEHEQSSLDLLDLMIENNSIKLEDYGLSPTDLEFIKELIDGPLDKAVTGYPYRGRGPEKYYLYEIISNKLTGVDVDKWDYFLRDSKSTGIEIWFKYERLITNMKIVDWQSDKFGTTIRRIAFRDKVTESCQDIFNDRSRLHQRIYQHKTVKVIDRMMIDAWLEADQYFPLINGLKLSEAAKDAKSLVRLTDEWVNQTILNSEEVNLQRARDILERIQRREKYRIIAEITGTIQRKFYEYERELSSDALAVAKTHIDMGMNNKNPVTDILFFDKSGKLVLRTAEELEHLVPSRVQYDKLFILLRDLNPSPAVEEESRKKVEILAAENKDWKVKWY